MAPAKRRYDFHLGVRRARVGGFITGIVSTVIGGPQFMRTVRTGVKATISARSVRQRVTILRKQLGRTFKAGDHLRHRVSALSVGSTRCSEGVLSLRHHCSRRCSAVRRVRIRVNRLRDRVHDVRRRGVSKSGVCHLLLTFSRICRSTARTRRGRFVGTFVRQVRVFPRGEGSKD